METQREVIQHEINITELLHTLFKGKIIIAVVMIIAIVISGVNSYFIQEDEYISTSILSANPISMNVANKEKTNSYIQSIINLPGMTMDDYLKDIRSIDVTKAVAEKVDITDKNGQKIDAALIRNALSITNPNGTNHIEISIKLPQAENAAIIANAVAECFIEYETLHIKKQFSDTANSLSDQIAAQNNIINNKNQEIIIYRNSNKDSSLIDEEINGLVLQIIQYKTNLRDLETQISSDYLTLQKLVVDSDSKIDFNLNEFAYSIGLSSESLETNQTEVTNQINNQITIDLSTDQLSEALLQVNINRIKTQLVENINQKKMIRDQIDMMSDELTSLRNELDDIKFKTDLLNQELSTAQELYTTLYQAYEEISMTSVIDLGRLNIKIISEAQMAEQPVSSNRLKKLLYAALLGLLAGVFVVMMIDYWKKEKKRNSILH